MTFIVGQVVLASDLITNPQTDAPVADPSEICTVYKPDGTTSTPSVIHPGQDDTDAYDVQITFDQPGWWEFVFLSSGAGAGAGRTRVYVSPVP
jgi:hypothetical protein